MTLLEAAVLGAVQGLTEFLPVSSSAHLIFAHKAFGMEGTQNLAFDLLLHLATLLAVILYFWRDLSAMVGGLFRDRGQFRLASLLVLAMIPTGIIGLGLKPLVESLFGEPNLVFVGGMLLITGTFLFIVPRIAQMRVGMDGIRLRHAFWIGCAQGIAALPGISRSGATICAGMFAGVQTESAARFSFLLALLAIPAAAVLDLKDMTSFELTDAPAIGVGMAVSFLVGMGAIHWLVKVARSNRFDGFAWYCWLAGIVSMVVTFLQTSS